jgi:putative hydrolase of the HAD superfamily
MGKNVNHNILKKITLQQFKPKKPVIDLMKRLRKKHKIVLLSNNTIWLDELDKKYGIYKNFDLVLSSHTVRMQKPDRKIFELLIRKSKAKPGEIVFIDDQERNLASARQMGMNCILFRNVGQLRRELASYGVKA